MFVCDWTFEATGFRLWILLQIIQAQKMFVCDCTFGATGFSLWILLQIIQAQEMFICDFVASKTCSLKLVALKTIVLKIYK